MGIAIIKTDGTIAQENNIGIFGAGVNSPLTYWRYRKKLTIDQTDDLGAGVNYQCRIDVHYGDGSDVTGAFGTAIVHTPGATVADFDDIRFTSSDGSTLLDHWCESYTASTSAIFWVEVPMPDDAADVDIYIYWDGTDTSASNIQNTFITGDDFIDGDYTSSPIWTVVQGTWSAATSHYLKQTSTGTPDEITTPASVTTFRVRARAMISTPASGSAAIMIGVQNASRADSYKIYWTYNVSGDDYIAMLEDGGTWDIGAVWTADNSYHLLELTRDSSSLWNLYLDGVNQGNKTDSTHTSWSTLSIESHSAAEKRIDWVFVSYYTTNEPTWETIGSTESFAVGTAYSYNAITGNTIRIGRQEV